MEFKRLKDILNMEDYLQNRCYCPNEIYSADGFFYQLFDKNEDCKYLGEESSKYNFIAVITKDTESVVQILLIFRTDDLKEIVDVIKYDATENNIKLVKDLINRKIDKAKFDEYEKGKTKKALEDIIKFSDAIMGSC